jgi:hypothetical protein
MRHGLLTKFLLFGCALATFGPAPARAQVTDLYNNTSTPLGFFYPNGGAATVGSTLTTTLVADDITAGVGLSGFSVNQIIFSIANGNATTVTISPQLQFYQSDPNTGLPTTLITAININPVTLTGNNGGLFTLTDNNAGGFFTMPSGLFWAGVVFTDGGTGSATAADLNNVGQLLFDPPTVGSSQDLFFQSNLAGPPADNPAGGLFFFGGPPLNPVANFGWEFGTTQAVPEPSTLALSAVGGLVLIGARLRRRRRSDGSTVEGATTV